MSDTIIRPTDRLDSARAYARILARARVAIAEAESEAADAKAGLERHRAWALRQPGCFSGAANSDVAILLRIIREALS
jgi:hypothetical protein